MEDCIFCKISKGDIPSTKIYEDEKVIAFLDIRPYTEGHTLLIPKEHYRWIWDMPDELVAHFHNTAKEISNHYQKVSGSDLVLSLTIGTLVEHCHYHIIPNSEAGFKEGLSELIEGSRMDLSSEELDRIGNEYKLKPD